jgi:membrane-associated phospholipid phosphatase
LKQQFLTFSGAWRNATQVKSFRIKLIIAGVLLIFCSWLAPIVFQYAEQRSGVLLSDFILEWLPPTDLSLAIFIIMDTLLIISIAVLLTKPEHFLIVLQAYVLLTLVRFVTIFSVPLDAPEGIVILHDPITDRFFYQGMVITKDLFFSGHTSILMLMAFGMPFPRLKIVLFTGATLVGIMLLIQHAHYTIDVLAAPLFAWLAILASKKVHGPIEKDISKSPSKA